MINQLKPSFAGGEISPSMYGRVDLAKYDNSVAELKNFQVLRSGGIANRPGTKYVAQTADNKRAVLLPFRYNAEQNYIIEITAGKVRFYSNGEIVRDADGSIYSISNDYNESELNTIKYTQSADVMFLVQADHPPKTLTRYGVTDWRLEKADIAGGPFDEADSGSTVLSTRLDEYRFQTAGTYTLTIPPQTSSVSVQLSGGGGGTGVTTGAGGSDIARRMSAAVRAELVTRVLSVTSGTLTIKVGRGGTDQNPGGEASTVSVGDAVVTAQQGGTYFGEHAGGTGAQCGRDGWVYVTCTISVQSGASITPSAVSGSITLTSTKDIFTRSDVGTVISLNQYVRSEYQKGNPLNDTLKVSALPKASVYVETFGFWNGNVIIEKYDDKSAAWVQTRKQEGNRTQNYNFTEKNESDNIVDYRVRSDAFDTSVWTNENERQRGFVTIQSFGNDYEGQVLITEYISATQVRGTVKRKLASTSSTTDFSFSAWSNAKGYPCCAGFFEDRLVFAGNRSSPQTFWTSKTGDYFNFGINIPSLDDDAVTATLNGGQMNGIKAMVAFDKMIMLTSGGEYLVSGEGNKAMSPSNVNSNAQEYRGINDVDPVVVGNRIVFVQQQGNIVRDLGYQYDVDKYTGSDLNILADHLFENHRIVRMTYQQTPNSTVWCVRDDGVLLGMTYIKEQDIFAWHQHETDGQFVDVCCIAGTQEDELWCVVQRNADYFIERFEHRDDTVAVDEQYFLDCGVTMRGMTGGVIGGLAHLAGRTVNVLADGNVLKGMQVSDDGQLTLGRDYSVVHVGLPYMARVKMLPIEISAQDGSFLTRKKRITSLGLFFKNSRGGRYGIEKMDEIKWRSTEYYGNPIGLFSGTKEIVLPSSSWGKILQTVVEQEEPLPLTVLALIPRIVTGG